MICFCGLSEPHDWPGRDVGEPHPQAGSVCVRGCCLAHRRAVYWSIEQRAWVHASGWRCAS